MTYLYKKYRILGNFKTNQSALGKQGWTFINLHCFQRVTFRKKHSDDSVNKFIKIYNFHTSLHKKVVVFFYNFQQNVLIIQSINMINMKNMMERKILSMTESKRIALMKLLAEEVIYFVSFLRFAFSLAF